MGYVIGGLLALLVAGVARRVGLDRDRAFYPTVLIVVGSYYVLFAVMGGSPRAVVLESGVMAVFALTAVAGLKYSSWLVVGGLAAHGIFDHWHPQVVSNAGVPEWWPAFCMAYDIGAALALAFAGLLPLRNSRLSQDSGPAPAGSRFAVSSASSASASSGMPRRW